MATCPSWPHPWWFKLVLLKGTSNNYFCTNASISALKSQQGDFDEPYSIATTPVLPTFYLITNASPKLSKKFMINLAV
jgi:hypothetical protein